MCNLYNLTSSHQAIIDLAQAFRDLAGNLPPSINFWPDRLAVIVRNNNGVHELARARWGMPSSSQALFEATKKRAEKLRTKGKPVDFDELLKVDRTAARQTSAIRTAVIGSAG